MTSAPLPRQENSGTENSGPEQTRPAVPRAGYPRPDRDRSARWLSLNGTWDLDLPDGVVPVTVPFAWETAASGVGRTWLEHATYRRRIAVPAGWDGHRAVLCFGAVHHHAVVRVDGRVIAEHTGGHTPFEADLDGVLEPGADGLLEVEVHAPADKRAIPHGKQRSIPRDDYDGVSFAPTSGIWQPVWLEARGRTYARRIDLTGDSLTGFDVGVELSGDAPAGATITVEVTSGSRAHERIDLVADGRGTAVGRLPLTEPRPWSPADPHLYVVTVTVAAAGNDAAPDVVHVTAGLRRFEARGEQLFLNDERIYLRGVLDQGYWPTSGLTAPDDDALVADLDHARELGYNLVRKHLKLEEPRWLHHADRTGMLVWAEPPGPSRFGTEAAAAFEAQLPAMVERDANHPGVVIWGLYNEEWGLDWDIPGSPERADAARAAYDLLRREDDTRPVVENSGWAHVRTDLVDWHYYDEDPAAWAANVAALADGTREDFPVRLAPDFLARKALYATDAHPRTGLPLLNSEYGAGFTSLERAWHLRWQTQELRRHDRFAGYVYTELTDVEHEMAGLLDADRRPKDRGGLDPRDVNADTVLVVDLVPRHAGADLPVPDDELTLDVHVSHHGSGPVTGRIRAAWVPAGAPFGAAPVAHHGASGPVEAKPFVLSPAVSVTVPAPGGPARLRLWLVDDDGSVRARTFVDAAPVEEPNRRGERW
ncbi:glycoside hydrolase family 2 protein [Myceligenerans pegani]|uniref:Glycoside hydrolase family 2 n=1 Tax=Myceligenerans pegani TaxID=2776917 RepID=A0ABR9MYY2_9MICO|nr:glycoside hydrolase family 2 TIM barrel-domain containing protein [Myceligenerans sp. TRM 65318]MBE1876068.1 glycoside hydrolase family 2 [Myceligenerans sp. TRM 65318]MBE3018339.1 glycoside hydrolase family 2 [Myceligenerans sp. TRM 65318]